MIPPHTVLPYVLALIINNNNEVLLGHRINTEWFPENYGLIGGKIEDNESATEALAREIFEETGLVIAKDDAHFAHIMHFKGVDNNPCIALFFVVQTWHGTLHNKEPDKNEKIEWFPLDKLPKNIIPRHAKAIELISKSILYSEDNWPHNKATAKK